MSLRKAAEMALEELECWVIGHGATPKDVEVITALRAALAEADEPPRREPLTLEQIETVRHEIGGALVDLDANDTHRVVRIVERAHGIGTDE